MVSYAENMYNCMAGLNTACGEWNPSARNGSAQISLSTFWPAVSGKGSGI